MNQLIIRGLNKLKLLSFLNINGQIKLNRSVFKIPILQKEGFANLFMSEPWMIKLLEIAIPIDQGSFVDVGVNIGQTLLKLRSVSPDTQYIGFEPNPKCVHYVDHLIKTNNIKQVQIIPVGVSEKTELGVLNFFDTSATDSSASMIAEFRSKDSIKRKEYIPLFEVSKVIDKVALNKISILKIDVEGAELEVLKSFSSIIREQQPIILLEILPTYNKENTFRIERQNQIQSLLADVGYTMYNVIKDRETLIGFNEISEIAIHSDLNRCEYVMVPGRKKEKFENNWKQLAG